MTFCRALAESRQMLSYRNAFPIETSEDMSYMGN